MNSSMSRPGAVRLFLPTRTLMQLDVSDPNYILRSPVHITNNGAGLTNAPPLGPYKKE